jgi:hypothetical protein
MRTAAAGDRRRFAIAEREYRPCAPAFKGSKVRGPWSARFTKLVADLALIAEERVLLVGYADPSRYDGQRGWFLPDDFLAHGEHPDDATRRIVEEQSGLSPRRCASSRSSRSAGRRRRGTSSSTTGASSMRRPRSTRRETSPLQRMVRARRAPAGLRGRPPRVGASRFSKPLGPRLSLSRFEQLLEQRAVVHDGLPQVLRLGQSGSTRPPQ